MAARSVPAVVFVPARLRQWRAEHHLSQEAMAKTLLYDRTAIGKIERGQVPPSPRFLELFHRVYDEDPQQFYQRPGAAR